MLVLNKRAALDHVLRRAAARRPADHGADAGACSHTPDTGLAPRSDARLGTDVRHGGPRVNRLSGTCGYCREAWGRATRDGGVAVSVSK